jgi:hypothetical protein
VSFRLAVDAERWRAHLAGVHAETPGLVPVVKGNGYGFGRELLAREAHRLGVGTVAVGVPSEVPAVRAAHGGDVLVMEPLRPDEASAAPAGDDAGVIRTVARLDVLRQVAALPRPSRPGRIVVELDSPVHRHGIGPQQLDDLARVLAGVPYEGVALHLPLRGPRLEAARATLSRLRAAGIRPPALWVSHLDGEELRTLAAEAGPIRVRPRVGTALWLGARDALRATGTVLDAHPVWRREAVGYRQRRAGTSGTLLVVSGGTSHGVGLRSPATGRGLAARSRDLLGGLAHGSGATPSPFRWRGRRLRFADVPHMQASMLLVPRGVEPPAIGTALECDVRMTVTAFDEVHLTEPLVGAGAAVTGPRATGAGW